LQIMGQPMFSSRNLRMELHIPNHPCLLAYRVCVSVVWHDGLRSWWGFLQLVKLP
jgi:hypothetical protein